jgi:phosphotransferase system IIB component
MTDMQEYIRNSGDEAELSSEDIANLPSAGCSSSVKEIPIELAKEEELESIRHFLGGKDNIKSSEPIAKTRLAITLNDTSLINPNEAKEKGYTIFVPKEGDEVHLIVGLLPERFKLLV